MASFCFVTEKDSQTHLFHCMFTKKYHILKKASISSNLRKDRPTSPSDLNGVSDGEYKHAVAQRSVSATGYRDQNGSSSPTYYGHSRRGSVASSANDQAPHEVLAAHVKIVRDTSKFWYKPAISREEG